MTILDNLEDRKCKLYTRIISSKPETRNTETDKRGIQMASGSRREVESPPVILEEGGSSRSLLRGTTRCCFCFTFRRRGSGFLDRIRSSKIDYSNNALWTRGVRAVQKIREWSELVAGPRWKTFIRRFNRKRSSRPVKFELYDPLSYTLNFDQGPADSAAAADEDNVYGGFRSFSVRYAAVPPRSGKGGAPEVGTGTVIPRAKGDSETCGGVSSSFS